jgi:hypothetical protein
MIMKMGLQDIDWAHAGACLARSDADEQATFFKAFVHECGTWGTQYQVELQLASVNRKLTVQERGCLSMIGYAGE